VLYFVVIVICSFLVSSLASCVLGLTVSFRHAPPHLKLCLTYGTWIASRPLAASLPQLCPGSPNASGGTGVLEAMIWVLGVLESFRGWGKKSSVIQKSASFLLYSLRHPYMCSIPTQCQSWSWGLLSCSHSSFTAYLFSMRLCPQGGLQTCGTSSSEGFVTAAILFWHFWWVLSKGHKFSFCTGPHKLCSWFWLPIMYLFACSVLEHTQSEFGIANSCLCAKQI
jgi:hypothetical protein